MPLGFCAHPRAPNAVSSLRSGSLGPFAQEHLVRCATKRSWIGDEPVRLDRLAAHLTGAVNAFFETRKRTLDRGELRLNGTEEGSRFADNFVIKWRFSCARR